MRMRWMGKYYVVRARFYTKKEIRKSRDFRRRFNGWKGGARKVTT